ncbi:MAG: formylglycine-generating enzyme family protein [Planctomycetes bacterium]|nr:formylglycine-generating enzyme family protein [Planctomycetota bacterium]
MLSASSNRLEGMPALAMMTTLHTTKVVGLKGRQHFEFFVAKIRHTFHRHHLRMLPSHVLALRAAVCILALAVTLPGQTRISERALERAAERFQTEKDDRTVAWEALARDYETCEAWFEGRDEQSPRPATLQAWLDHQEVSGDQVETLRNHWAERGPFHELWNQELYRTSAAAQEFERATADLEAAFHALEKLRHPERYTKGSEDIPHGMVLIPGAKFQLPASSGWIAGHPNHQQSRTVNLKSFYIDRYEVRCAEFAQFLLAQPRGLREGNLPAGWSWTDDGSPLFPPEAASHPVTGISWVTAARYAEWAGKRLPTEDEWQAAASGDTQRRYPMGQQLDAAQVVMKLSGHRAPKSVTAIGQDRTPQGVVGMTGNVREWGDALWLQHPTARKAKSARKVGPQTLATVKGGSFEDDADSCKSGYRWLYPALDTRRSNVGFRCARSVK